MFFDFLLLVLPVNLLDIASLLPAADASPTTTQENQKKPQKKKLQKKSSSFIFKSEKTTQDKKSSNKKSQNEASKSSSKNNFLESMGIQMVDDIFDDENENDVDKVSQSIRQENDVSVSDESVIKTEKSDDCRKSKFQRQDSVSEIISEIKGQSAIAQKSISEVIR